MSDPRLEVGAILRRHGAAFREKFGDAASARQLAVLKSLSECRTSALGGHLFECDKCHQKCVVCNSCRDRHCPTCRAYLAREWAEAREAEMLPVPYFFATFTQPHTLNPLAKANQAVVYALLFQAVSDTLLTIAADPSRLGARIGFFALLHTWGENLEYHPHLHVVIPGGGLSLDGQAWIKADRKYFLPTKVLSKRFRTIFSRLLRAAFHDKKLKFRGAALQHLAEWKAFNAFVDSLWVKDWVVHIEPPAGRPTDVIRYVARYAHRVAISNERLVAADGDEVTIRYKDYADGGRTKLLTLKATEFIRRFLLHVVPKRFVRIRYYGFLANCHRKKKLEHCRDLIAEAHGAHTPRPAIEQPQDANSASGTEDPQRHCPFCPEGRLRILCKLKPNSALLRTLPTATGMNSS